ncbi:MAG TPA: MmgE/PrpD family protein [Devosia sp.]|nr:MmgE/PrpD family protein [Devosia sp.]
MTTASERLGAHFAGLRLNKIPASLQADIKTLVQDYFGVALGGSATESARIAARFVCDAGGVEQARLIGTRRAVPAMHAAFANAIASHSIELDDVDVLALFHFSPPIVSAALAVAEAEKSSGADFLLAVAAGCEMLARMSAATNNSLRDRGFHTTPTCGVFGAAVAAGILLHLDTAQMVSAIGLAGAQAGGLMEMYGPSMQKRFNPGPAARNGVLAAQMAKGGFTGAATILDGERGFCRAFSDAPDFSKLTDGLGIDFPVHVEFKPYSCARPIHNAIDCALDIRGRLDEPLSDVIAITMHRHPDWAHYHLNAHPSTYHEAQVSLPYSVAVALIEGAALFPQYRDEKLGDPEIRRLSDMVVVVPDATLPRGVSCAMTLETKRGARLKAQVDHPRGSIRNPMSPAERASKVHVLADPVIGASQADELIGLIGELEALTGVGPLMEKASVSATAA